MLMARQHFFSADNLDLGFRDLEQHTIYLKDKDPVFSPQFRLPAEHLKLIQYTSKQTRRARDPS
jgi:hypothetical protein